MKSVKNKSIVVLGAGGHTGVLIEALIKMKRNILGITDPTYQKGEDVHGITILGDDSVLESLSVHEVDLVNGIGGMPGIQQRFLVAKKWRKKGFYFAKIVHPKAILAKTVVLQEGAQVMAGAILQQGVFIGKDTIINTGAVVDHDCKIGRNVHIASSAVLCGEVTVDDDAFIGAGSVVLQGKSVGARAVVAAGSVVHKDVSVGKKLIQKRIEVLD